MDPSNLAQTDLSSIYAVVGGFVVLNIGTLITLVITLIKFSFKMGEAKAILNKVAKDVDSAHQFIREIKNGK